MKTKTKIILIIVTLGLILIYWWLKKVDLLPASNVQFRTEKVPEILPTGATVVKTETQVSNSGISYQVKTDSFGQKHYENLDPNVSKAPIVVKPKEVPITSEQLMKFVKSTSKVS